MVPTVASDQAAVPSPGVSDFLASRAIRKSDLTSGTKCVLEAIADKARYGRSVCTASFHTLARLINRTRQQVYRHIGQLARSDWIVIEHRSSEARGFQPNHVRMGPRFFEAVEEQARREEEERKRHPPPRFVAQSLPLGQPLDPRGISAPTLGASAPLPWGHQRPYPRGIDAPQRTPIKDSLKDSMSSSSPTPTPARQSDDDDVRFAPKESGGSKQKAKPLSDADGLEMVCQVANTCARLPGVTAKIRAATELAHRCNHDWPLLAAAFVRLDAKVAAGDARPKNPVVYALAMLPEMRSMDFPSAELESLQADVARRLQPSDEEVKVRAQARAWALKGTTKGDPPGQVIENVKKFMFEHGHSETRIQWAEDELLKLFKEAS